MGHLRWSRRRIFGMRAMRTVTRRPRLTKARWGATAPAVRSAQPARGERGAGDTSVRNILRSCSGTIAARDAHAHTAATAGPGGEGDGSEGEEVPSLGWLRFIKSFGRG